MTVKIEGFDRVIWRLAKGNDTVTMPLIKEKIVEYTQFGTADQISDYTCYERVVMCVGNAIDTGLVKNHMFVDAMKQFNPDPILVKLLPDLYNNDDRSTELKVIHALLSMIRFVQVKDGVDVLVDFGQYDSIQDQE